MRVLNLQQGSPEWAAHRARSRNASDAPAMMGVSPYVSRADLLRHRATCVEREVSARTQAVFDRGHEVEPALRRLAEKMCGEEFEPIVGVSADEYLSASFDGMNWDGSFICEVKQTNAGKMANVERDAIPAADYWQVVQQFAVAESARVCLYLVGDGTEAGTRALKIKRERVAADIPKLRAAWAQFDADVANYTDEPEAEPVIAKVAESLPTVSVRVSGSLAVASNLDVFGERLRHFIAELNLKPETDQDFADCENAIKTLSRAEDALDAAENQAMSQVAMIDELRRTKGALHEAARTNRLMLEKLVKARKEAVKAEIVMAARNALSDHIAAINATISGFRMEVPQATAADFAAAIKGLRTLDSVKNAVDTTLARLKIEASQQADGIRVCLKIIDEAGSPELFRDRVQLVTKSPDDLRNLIAARIAERDRLAAELVERERERIRAEEAAKLAAQTFADEAARQTAQPAPVEVSMPATEARPAPLPAAPVSALVKLGDINSRIAPLTISAEGLASLGFHPVGTDKAAKLYAMSDLPNIFGKLAQRLVDAARSDALARAA